MAPGELWQVDGVACRVQGYTCCHRALHRLPMVNTAREMREMDESKAGAVSRPGGMGPHLSSRRAGVGPHSESWGVP